MFVGEMFSILASLVSVLLFARGLLRDSRLHRERERLEATLLSSHAAALPFLKRRYRLLEARISASAAMKPVLTGVTSLVAVSTMCVVTLTALLLVTTVPGFDGTPTSVSAWALTMWGILDLIAFALACGSFARLSYELCLRGRLEQAFFEGRSAEDDLLVLPHRRRRLIGFRRHMVTGLLGAITSLCFGMIVAAGTFALRYPTEYRDALVLAALPGLFALLFLAATALSHVRSASPDPSFERQAWVHATDFPNSPADLSIRPRAR